MAVRRRPSYLTVVACCALIAPARAIASPGSDPTIGRGVFTGVTVPQATSIELNPAALGLGTFDEFYVAAAAVIDQIAINRRTLDLATDEFREGDHIRAAEIGPGATLGGVWHVLDRVTLGGSLSTPPSEQFVTDRSPLRYHTLGGSQRDYKVTAGFGFRANSRFHFGFSVTFDNAHLALHYMRDSALEAGHGPGGIGSDCNGTPCGVENPAAAERYDINVAQSVSFKGGYIVNFGFVTRVANDVYIGLAYHTPPGGTVQTELSGDARVTAAPRDGGAVSNGAATVYVSYPASVDGEVRARVAEQLDLHVGGRWTDLSRLSAYDVRIVGTEFTGKHYPEATLRPRGLHDVFALWGGVEQTDTGERLRLGGRIGIETEGVSANQTSPMTIAPTSFTIDAGAQLRISQSLMLQLTYGLQYFPTVNVTESAYDPRDRIDCIDSGFDYSTRACASVRNGYAIPTAAGEYGRLEHAIRLGIRYVRD